MWVIGQVTLYIVPLSPITLHFYIKRPYEYVWPILNLSYYIIFFDIFISLSYTYYTVNASKSELFPMINSLSSAERIVNGLGGTSKSSHALIPTALRLYFSRRLESFKQVPPPKILAYLLQ